MTKTAVKQPELFAPAKEAPKAKPPAKRRAEPKSASTAVAVHKPQEPRSLLEVILEASKNPAIDVAKMKELFAFKLEIERAEKERHLDMAIAAVKADLPPEINAESFNRHTKSWWARYEAISKVIDPLIRKHGLVLSFGMSDSPIDNHYRVICDVTHLETGFKRRYFLDGPSDAAGAKGGGTKSPIQGVKSTITYLQRVLKCLIFDIVVGREDRDGQGNAPEAISEEQVDQILSICAEKGIDRATFSKAFGVPEVESIPITRFADVIARLKSAPKQQPKNKASDA